MALFDSGLIGQAGGIADPNTPGYAGYAPPPVPQTGGAVDQTTFPAQPGGGPGGIIQSPTEAPTPATGPSHGSTPDLSQYNGAFLNGGYQSWDELLNGLFGSFGLNNSAANATGQLQGGRPGGGVPMPPGTGLGYDEGADWTPEWMDEYCKFVEARGFRCQRKASDGGKPSGRVYLPDGTCYDLNVNGKIGSIKRDCSGEGTGGGTPGGLGGNRFLGQLGLPSIFGPGFDFGSGGGAGDDFLANGPVFTDSATIDWETALRDFVTRLRQPIVNPDLDPLMNYLRSEFSRLQGPAYTPQELDLLQTQVFDPLNTNRDTERQNILNWAASHGMGPDDGPTQQLLSDLNRQYNVARTTGSRDVALKAIDLERQNHQQAQQVGSMLTGIQDQIFNHEEERIAQAVGLLQQIPALADSRLALANSVLMGGQAAAGVAGSAANYLASIYNTNAQQQAANSASNRNFWSGLIGAFATAAPYIFG